MLKFQWLKRPNGGVYPAIVHDEVGRRVVVRSWDITTAEAAQGLDWLRKAYPLEGPEPDAPVPAGAPRPKAPELPDAVAA